MANLEGANWISDLTLSDIIIRNVIDFIGYGFLQLGGYYNIGTGQLNYLGADESILLPLNVTGVTPYTVYRGLKSPWVWESNILLKNPTGIQPYPTTGVLVNGIPTNTGHYIDYSRGQIVFTNPLASGTTVKSQYSIKTISVYPMDGNEYRDLNYTWNNRGSGFINDISEKGYLPAVFVDVIDWNTIKGTEIGSRGKLSQAILRFDVYAQNGFLLRKILDILYMLETKVVPLYDIKNSPKPLDSRGRLVNPTGSWPYLVTNYPIGEGRFNENASVKKLRNSNIPIHKGIVEIGLEFDTYPT